MTNTTTNATGQPRRNNFGAGYGWTCTCGEPISNVMHSSQYNEAGVRPIINMTCPKFHVWLKTPEGWALA